MNQSDYERIAMRNRHKCCDDAKYCMGINHNGEWEMVLFMQHVVVIEYCPWCGEKLETK